MAATADDILGEYNYNSDLSLEEITVYGRSLQDAISNYRTEKDEAINVVVIK